VDGKTRGRRVRTLGTLEAHPGRSDRWPPHQRISDGAVAQVFARAVESRPEFPFRVHPDDSAFLRGGKDLLDSIQNAVHSRAHERARLGNLQQEDVVHRALLAARKKAQLATVDQFKVFYRFHFVDRVKENGITFVNHVVEDAAKNYMAAHYDHGNGIAVADVDGDGLYEIYFTNQVGGNQLWKNLGGGKFKNITEEAGVGVPGRIRVTASFADIDNDGAQDLFVTTVRGCNVLFKNDDHGHFKDISKEAGVDLSTHSSGAVFFDYDYDGLVDLLVCNVG